MTNRGIGDHKRNDRARANVLQQNISGGIPRLINDDSAFLSFICCFTAMEALGGFLAPAEGNGARFKAFVKGYFPNPYPANVDELWKARNAIVHGFSPGPFGLTHHNSTAHLKRIPDGRLVLNAEDFYAALVFAAKQYFDALATDSALQTSLVERVNDNKTGFLVVVATRVS